MPHNGRLGRLKEISIMAAAGSRARAPPYMLRSAAELQLMAASCPPPRKCESGGGDEGSGSRRRGACEGDAAPAVPQPTTGPPFPSLVTIRVLPLHLFLLLRHLLFSFILFSSFFFFFFNFCSRSSPSLRHPAQVHFPFFFTVFISVLFSVHFFSHSFGFFLFLDLSLSTP